MKQITMDWETYQSELKSAKESAKMHAYSFVVMFLEGDKDVIEWFKNEPNKYGNIAAILDKYYIKLDTTYMRKENESI